MNIDEAILLTHDRLAGEDGNLGDLLGNFRHMISPNLIGDREWGNVLECAGSLPVTMAALPFGFELPLHEPEPLADFGVSAASGTSMAEYFEERARSDETDRLAHAINRLFSEMDASNSPLREIAGRKLMLEYDIGSAPDGKPSFPGMFLRPGERPIIGGAGQTGDMHILNDALANSVGWERNDSQRKSAERAYLAQPEDTRMDSFGIFPSRSRSLRLAVMGFKNQEDVCEYLKKSGWPGEIEAVESLISRFRERVGIERTGLNIDVRENGLGPTLGMTLIVKQRFTKDSRYWLDGLTDWEPFLNALSLEEIVVRKKLDELANWVSKPSPLFAKTGRYIMLRGIHHIKLVLSEGRLEKAKAYVFMVISGAALT